MSTSAIALGCMGMSEFYSGRDVDKSARTVAAAIDAGVQMFDTADMYGPFTNEVMLGALLRPHRPTVQIATKFGYVRAVDGTRLGLCGRPDYVRTACCSSLRRLNVDVIDLYYLHRVDPNVPVEETIGAMGELVQEGLVRHIGISEASSATISRANAIFPLTAVQTEYSLLTRDVEADILQTVRARAVGFVAYAPLARGLLTGKFRRVEDLQSDDYRRGTPRFSPGNIEGNVSLLNPLLEISRLRGVSPAAMALAWVMNKAPDIVALVGARTPEHLLDCAAGALLHLSEDEMQTLDVAFPLGITRGARYPDMSRVNG